jgi:hypothetical protein
MAKLVLYRRREAGTKGMAILLGGIPFLPMLIQRIRDLRQPRPVSCTCSSNSDATKNLTLFGGRDITSLGSEVRFFRLKLSTRIFGQVG